MRTALHDVADAVADYHESLADTVVRAAATRS